MGRPHDVLGQGLKRVCERSGYLYGARTSDRRWRIAKTERLLPRASRGGGCGSNRRNRNGRITCCGRRARWATCRRGVGTACRNNACRGGKHWRGRPCGSKWRSRSTTGRGGDVFDKRSGLSHQLVHLPVSTLFGCEDKHACVNEGLDHITGMAW